MQHFAESRFWRAIAAALVVGVFYLGWAITGERTVLPVAHAGGVMAGPGGAIYTTNEAGDVLYVWNTNPAHSFPFEQWTFATSTVLRKNVVRFDNQISPVVPGTGPYPAGPGGLQPRGPGQGPGGPGPGSGPGPGPGSGGDGGWERPR